MCVLFENDADAVGEGCLVRLVCVFLSLGGDRVLKLFVDRADVIFSDTKSFLFGLLAWCEEDDVGGVLAGWFRLFGRSFRCSARSSRLVCRLAAGLPCLPGSFSASLPPLYQIGISAGLLDWSPCGLIKLAVG